MTREYCVPYANFQDGVAVTLQRPNSAIFPTYIETDRLIFKRLTTTQLHTVYELTQQTPTELFEKCWWQPYKNLHSLREHIIEVESQHTTGERAEYVLYEKSDDTKSIGVCHFSPDYKNGIGRLGIWFHPDYWGNEYAVEHTTASISIFFECLDIPVVQAWCSQDNTNSKQALEKSFSKMGGKCDGRIRRGYWGDKIVFSITEDEYYERGSTGKLDTAIGTTISENS